MKIIRLTKGKYCFEYEINYVPVLKYYRSSIKIFERGKMYPINLFLLLKKSFTAHTEKEAEDDTLMYINNFANMNKFEYENEYEDEDTQKICLQHEYIPMFTWYVCKHCGKEREQ
jgi:hypothetical protein